MLVYEDQVRQLVKQYRETRKIVKTTLKPDTFFGRLNFMCDLLLALQQYEDVEGMFTHNNPSNKLNRLAEIIDAEVADFVLRYMNDVYEETRNRKTQSGRKNYYETKIVALIAAFDYSQKFWQGNGVLPHYSGPLFSDRVFAVVQTIWDEFCDKDFSEIKI